MDEATRARALAAVQRLANWVDSEVPGRKRPGILVLRDEGGKRRRLYRHQVAAVNRLLTKGGATTDWNARNASLLAVHEMGTGKTITAILALAAIHQIAPPHASRRGLIVCPLSVLRVWEDTLRSWTTLGETLLVADKQADLTTEALASASVVVTTPDVLQSAYKSVWELDPSSKARRKMDRYRRIPGAPMHPLFALCATPATFCLAVVDELHKCCKDSTIAGRAIRILCKAATFKLGLTGTPVTARPQQLAHLAQALNAQPAWLQSSGAFVAKRVPGARGTTGEGSIDRKSFEAFHAELVDRVGPDALDLPPKRHVTIEFDPHVGFSGVGEARADPNASHAHNAMLREAQTVVGDARRGGQARAVLWRGGARHVALLRRVLQLRVPRDTRPARRRRLQGEARALRRVRRGAEPVHGARGARHRQPSARGARARRRLLGVDDAARDAPALPAARARRRGGQGRGRRRRLRRGLLLHRRPAEQGARRAHRRRRAARAACC